MSRFISSLAKFKKVQSASFAHVCSKRNILGTEMSQNLPQSQSNSFHVFNLYHKCKLFVFKFNYCIYSHIIQWFWLNFDIKSVGVGLYAGHATQPKSTFSITATSQGCSLCVCGPHTAWTISRLLGLHEFVGEWAAVGSTTRRLLLLHSI